LCGEKPETWLKFDGIFGENNIERDLNEMFSLTPRLGFPSVVCINRKSIKNRLQVASLFQFQKPMAGAHMIFILVQTKF
jgi:hypothetical protein